MPLNWVFRRDAELRRAIKEWGDYLEVLFDGALNDTRQVSITTKSGKFYIGFITRNFDPAYERKYVTVLPTASGYRDTSSQVFRFTANYTKVYQQLLEKEPGFLLTHAEDFQIVIPVAEIRSANVFDPEVYELFRAEEEVGAA